MSLSKRRNDTGEIRELKEVLQKIHSHNKLQFRRELVRNWYDISTQIEKTLPLFKRYLELKPKRDFMSDQSKEELIKAKKFYDLAAAAFACTPKGNSEFFDNLPTNTEAITRLPDVAPQKAAYLKEVTNTVKLKFQARTGLFSESKPIKDNTDFKELLKSFEDGVLHYSREGSWNVAFCDLSKKTRKGHTLGDAIKTHLKAKGGLSQTEEIILEDYRVLEGNNDRDDSNSPGMIARVSMSYNLMEVCFLLYLAYGKNSEEVESFLMIVPYMSEFNRIETKRETISTLVNSIKAKNHDFAKLLNIDNRGDLDLMAPPLELNQRRLYSMICDTLGGKSFAQIDLTSYNAWDIIAQVYAVEKKYGAEFPRTLSEAKALVDRNYYTLCENLLYRSTNLQDRCRNALFTYGNPVYAMISGKETTNYNYFMFGLLNDHSNYTLAVQRYISSSPKLEDAEEAIPFIQEAGNFGSFVGLGTFDLSRSEIKLKVFGRNTLSGPSQQEVFESTLVKGSQELWEQGIVAAKMIEEYKGLPLNEENMNAVIDITMKNKEALDALREKNLSDMKDDIKRKNEPLLSLTDVRDFKTEYKALSDKNALRDIISEDMEVLKTLTSGHYKQMPSWVTFTMSLKDPNFGVAWMEALNVYIDKATPTQIPADFYDSLKQKVSWCLGKLRYKAGYWGFPKDWKLDDITEDDIKSMVSFKAGKSQDKREVIEFMESAEEIKKFIKIAAFMYKLVIKFTKEVMNEKTFLKMSSLPLMMAGKEQYDDARNAIRETLKRVEPYTKVFNAFDLAYMHVISSLAAYRCNTKEAANLRVVGYGVSPGGFRDAFEEEKAESN